MAKEKGAEIINIEPVSSFSERIKELIGDKSYSEFGKEVGLSKQTISAYVNGERNPKRPFIQSLSLLYNLNPAWLLGYDVPRERIPVTSPADEDIVILNRAAKKMTEEDRKKLIEMAKVMFKEAFDDPT